MYARPCALTFVSLLLCLCLSLGRPAHAAGSVIYVSNSGNDANSGQSLSAAKKTIQAGCNTVSTGGTVFIEPGTYTGAGNNAIFFGPDENNSRNMIVQSDPANGGSPANTIINLQGADEPAFSLGPGLTAAAEVYGLTIENSNYGGPGGAISIGDSSPTIQNCVFSNNHGSVGGAIILGNSNATIRECTFTGNQAVPSDFSVGGAIEIGTTTEVTSGTFTPVVTNCLFSQNTAQTDGAAIDVSNGLQPVILNAEITNCTFTGNTSTYTDATDPGGTVGVFSANVAITNCILFSDTVLNGGQGGEITIVPPGGDPAAAVTATYSDIQQASSTYPGSHNSNQDPKFASGLDLAAGSPVINAGTPSVPAGVDISIDRTGRARDSQPDLGAYEVLSPTANGQSVSVPFNTATAITLTGSDPNVTPRSLTFGYTQPSHGTVTGTAPNVTYTPTAGYYGADSFTFTVNNGTYSSASATVSLTVATGTPTANSQSVSVPFNTATAITLTGSDPDSPPLSLTYTVATSPTHGTLTGTAPNLTYTPNAGYHGADTFTFTVSNGTKTSSAATVSITVSFVPATVTGVAITWGTAGTASLTTAADGLRLLPSGRSTDLPWLGIQKLVVTLSQAATLSASDVSVTGVNVANYGPVTVSGSGTSYTITLAQPINTADRVTITLGNATVATYTRRLDVLPGDVSDDGIVNSGDAVLVRNMLLGFEGASPTIFGDINGDGVVDITDYNLVRQHIGSRLP